MFAERSDLISVCRRSPAHEPETAIVTALLCTPLSFIWTGENPLDILCPFLPSRIDLGHRCGLFGLNRNTCSLGEKQPFVCEHLEKHFARARELPPVDARGTRQFRKPP